MSEPQQPPVPPTAPPSPTQPAAPHLSAEPQYPTGTHALGATLSPPSPQAHPTAPPAPQAYPTAVPSGYATPASGPQGYAPVAPGYPTPPSAPERARSGNPIGRTAFVIAVATLAINLLGSLARPFFYGVGPGYDIMFVLDNGIGILSFFAYATALVLAVIAVRRAAPQLLSGIAIGIGGTGALGLLFSSLTIGLYRYF